MCLLYFCQNYFSSWIMTGDNLSIPVVLNTLFNLRYTLLWKTEWVQPSEFVSFHKAQIYQKTDWNEDAYFKCASTLPVLQPTCTTPSSQPRITSCLPILNLKGLSLSRDESNLRPSVREPINKEMAHSQERSGAAANAQPYSVTVTCMML